MDDTRNRDPNPNPIASAAPRAPEAPHSEGHPPMDPTHHDEHHEPMPEGEELAPPGTRTMATIRWILVALMALLATGAVLQHFGVIDLRRGGAAATMYHCPMHPNVIQDHPGECPICGMDLVPVAQHGAATPDGHAHEGHAAAKSAGHEGHRHEPTDPYACPMHPDETSQDPNARCPQCKMKLEKRDPAAAGTASGDTYVCPMCPGVSSKDPNAECPKCGMRLEKKSAGADLYACPMHPEVTSTDPNAECPKCGMRLEKKAPEGAHGEHGAEHGSAAGAGSVPGLVPIHLSPERIQLTGMRTEKVTRAQLSPELRTVGTIAANEQGIAFINTRFAGWIEQLHVAETGVKVQKGQVLATIYSPELFTAQQEFLNARRWASQGGAGVGAGLEVDARRRLELLGISPQEIAEIEKAGQPLRGMRIRSPVSGYVVQKTALQGLYVQPGAELFQVADLSKVWVLADIYENEIGRVKVGQKANLSLPAYPGKTFPGKLEFVYPTLNTDTRTLRVRLSFRNPDLMLKPGMYGDVAVQLASAEGVVAPREAIVDSGDHQYVFLALPGGRFEPRSVKLGARFDSKVEVVEGLAEGDVVVTTANFLIDSESRLRAAIEGHGNAAPAHAGHDHGSPDAQVADGQGR